MSAPLPKTQKVSLFEEHSDSPDVIKYTDYATPQIELPTDVIIKNRYAGVNFIEAYFRKGWYPSELPHVGGREAAGVVAAVGSDVKRFKVGDAVAYFSANTFAQYTKIPELYVQISKLDDASDDALLKQAASLLQGLTALTFVEEAYAVKKGDHVLVWAAAGGVGKLLVQLLKRKGATVLAVASTADKLAQVGALGADVLINLSSDDVVAKVAEATGAKGGVDAVFDSVGKDSFERSLAALKRKGTLVSYGNASGPVPPLTILRLTAKNVTLLRPTLSNYVATHDEWEHYAPKLAALVSSGELKVDISRVYPLSQYRDATVALESRKTTGKLVLEIPQ